MVEKIKMSCIVVHKYDAEKAIRVLRKHGLLATDFKVMRCKDVVKIPTIKPLTKNVKIAFNNEDISFKETVDYFERKSIVKTYKDLVKNIPKEAIDKLPSSYDIVGEAILIRIPEEAMNYAQIIGEALLRFHKNIKGVYAVTGETYGEERLTPLKLIAGNNVEKTVYVEHGVKFVVNIGKTYINPSLSFEHHRIAEEVGDGEKILDMFCGIGGFSLTIACRKKAEICAADINPYAIKSLISSLKINKLKGTIYPILGDSAYVFSKFFNKTFDRVIMNLPGNAYQFLKYACRVLSGNGGIIHYYRFAEAINEVIFEFLRLISSFRSVVKILNIRKVIEVSPRKRLYVIDAYVM